MNIRSCKHYIKKESVLFRVPVLWILEIVVVSTLKDPPTPMSWGKRRLTKQNVMAGFMSPSLRERVWQVVMLWFWISKNCITCLTSICSSSAGFFSVCLFFLPLFFYIAPRPQFFILNLRFSCPSI